MKDIVREQVNGPHNLRSKIPANRNYKDFVKVVQHDSAASVRSGGSRLSRHTLYLTVISCMILSTSANLQEPDDLLTFPQFGAVAELCGKVAVEKEELYIPMVLRFNFDNHTLLHQLGCQTNGSYAQRWLSSAVAKQVRDMQTDLHLPSWLVDSMNIDYTPPFAQRAANFVQAVSRPKRQIFDLINLALGISGTALGAYSTAMITKLQSQQSAIVQQMNTLTDRSNEDHENLVEVTVLEQSLYTYTHTQFGKLASSINAIQCDQIASDVAVFYLMERLRILLKLYSDFNAAASTLFRPTLSPVLLPLKHAITLIRKLPQLTNSVYMLDPTDLYNLATVHAIFPITGPSLGYILKIPVILRPEMTLLYCVTNLGVVVNATFARRAKLPRHIVHYSQAADPDCELARYNIRNNGGSSTNVAAINAYTECIRSGLRTPDLQNCRQVTNGVYVCREALTLKPSRVHPECDRL